MRRGLRRALEAGLSHNDIRELLNGALKARFEAENTWLWVRDVGEDWVVYELEDEDSCDSFKIGYTVGAETNVATLVGEPAKVIGTTDYQPVAESRAPTTDRLGGRVLEARGIADDGGRIFRVQVVAAGTSRNGVRYSEAVLATAAPLYDGAKAFDHHRTAAELQSSTIAGLVGSYRNVEATATGVEADLHLLPSATHTAEALDASLAAQASGLGPVVGISHDIQLAHRPALEGGRTIREATAIRAVLSADVVADPSAGGRVTRMVAGGTGADTDPEEGPMTIEELLALLGGATPEQRDQALTSLGVTADQLKALADNDPPPPDPPPPAPPADDKVPVPAGAVTEATMARGSLQGGALVRLALEHAHLDGRLAEAVTERLPERFTEADVRGAVSMWQEAFRAVEKAVSRPLVPHVEVGTEAIDAKRDRLVRTLESDGREGYLSLRHAWIDITGGSGLDLISGDLAATIIRESYVGHNRYEGRQSEAVDTTTWGSVFADALNKRVIAEYRRPALSIWRALVSSIVPRTDFRDAKLSRIGGYGTLPLVPEGTPYQPLVTPPDEDVRYAVDKRGGTEDLTMEAVANDDLSQVRKIPVALGRAAAWTLYRAIFDLLSSNAVIYDAVALFAAAHNNTDAAAPLTQATLSAGRRKMRKQAAYGDSIDILSLTPKYLLVPSDLEEIAFQLANSAVAITGTADATTPNIHQGLEPIVVDYWTDANDWFLLADPASCPTVEVGFYRGAQEPELFVQDDPRSGAVFTADKIAWKIRHIWGLAVLDYRCAYRGQG